MGCNQSSSGGPAVNGRKKSSSGPMTKEQIGKRIDSIDETRAVSFGRVRVRYAYVSQRGYYPDDKKKPNQDAYSVTHDFGGHSSDVYLGVYDGHGRDGDKCAQFVRDVLPPTVATAMNEAKSRFAEGTELPKGTMQDLLMKAHRECNRKMHRQKKFDDTLSGTTSISMYLDGNNKRITVSNVGDSRSVIGRAASVEKEGTANGASTSSLKAFALSRDQTPYRRDERVRIRRAGGRILSLDQIEGLEPVDDDEAERDRVALENGSKEELVLGEEIDEGGDPPRVWSPNGDYPGTAFSRSLGDSVAESLGVHADPEVLTRELAPEDKIIVLASDGVFEFLTNQSVVDMCAKFSDPLEACRAVVAESYELWLQYELRTDDITMICIFVDSLDGTADEGEPGEEADADPTHPDFKRDDSLIAVEARPVRAGVTVEKSRDLVKRKAKAAQIKDVTSTKELEENFDVESLFTEKSDADKLAISKAICASVAFKNITDDQRELIYKAMEPMSVKAGQRIIEQGTIGDRFYIVDKGSFEVRVLEEDEFGELVGSYDGGNKVHVYEGSRENNQHPSFGELALIHSAPRAASVIAHTDGQLWALHRYAFKKVTAEHGTRQEAKEVLRKIAAFEAFTADQLTEMATYLCETKFGPGDTICEEGQVGESLYIVVPGGRCESVYKAMDQTITKELGGDDYFGEEILGPSGDHKYVATVTATGKCSCWTLSRHDVHRATKKQKRRSKGLSAGTRGSIRSL